MKKVSLITLTVFTFISLFWTDANAHLATANSSSGTTAAAAVTEFCARSAITGECVTPTTNSISIPVDDTTDDAADANLLGDGIHMPVRDDEVFGRLLLHQ